MAPGYVGKILKINLNDLSYSVEEKDEYFYRTFMGGSAMASYFLDFHLTLSIKEDRSALREKGS